MNLRRAIQKYLEQGLSDLGWGELANPVTVEHTSRPEFGEYTTHVTFKLAKALNLPLPDVGTRLVEKLRQLIGHDPTSLIARVELFPSGFINFYLDRVKTFQMLLHFQPEQPILDAAGDERQVVVEHTAVNPNKEMHIGHLRNACIGDVLARVLRKSGAQVEVQNLINDLGVQVTSTILGLRELNLTQKAGERFDEFASRVYVEITKRLKTDKNLRQMQTELHRDLETTQGASYTELVSFVDKILRIQLDDLTRLNIHYDFLIKESATLEFGLWEKAFAALQNVPAFVSEKIGPNSGTWLIKSESGDPMEDKIIVKSDGTVTYTGKDLAYHLWKFGLIDFDFTYREWEQTEQQDQRTPVLYTTDRRGKPIPHMQFPTEIVNVIASEQNYPQMIVRDSLRKLGFARAADNYHHLAYEMVALSRSTAQQLEIETSDDREVYHMSGRQGIHVSFRQLLGKMLEKVRSAEIVRKVSQARVAEVASHDEIALAAIRYYLTRFSYSTPVIFDFAQALSLEGNTGPYLQYAHARAAGILSQSGDPSTLLDKSEPELALVEWELIAWLLRFPEVVVEVSLNYDVTGLTNYAYQLATIFNAFYEKCPVLSAGTPALTQQRLDLTKSFKRTMAEVLGLLGMTAPNAM